MLPLRLTHIYLSQRTTTPDRVLPPALPDGQSQLSTLFLPCPAPLSPHCTRATQNRQANYCLKPLNDCTLFSADNPQPPHLLRAPASLAHPGFQPKPALPALPCPRPDHTLLPPSPFCRQALCRGKFPSASLPLGPLHSPLHKVLTQKSP